MFLPAVRDCDRPTTPRTQGERHEGGHRIAHPWDSGRGRCGSTIYMPITRDLSGGKRELLRRWCNLQQ